MKKYKFIKKVENNNLVDSENFTITYYNDYKILVSEYVNFKKSGLCLVGRTNESFWGLENIFKSLEQRGFKQI